MFISTMQTLQFRLKIAFILRTLFIVLLCIIMQKLLNCLCTKGFSFHILKYIIATDVARHVASLYRHLSFLHFFIYVHTHSIIYPLFFSPFFYNMICLFLSYRFSHSIEHVNYKPNSFSSSSGLTSPYIQILR